jgi:type IV pilus assembly protein PilX
MGTDARREPPGFARDQRGAVLYVALIILLLMTLLGLVGMQVATMQERMASNYRQQDQAFQRAEASVRLTEAALKSSAGSVTVTSSLCTFDALAWTLSQGTTAATHVRLLNCDTTTGTSSNLGQKVATTSGAGSGTPYEITAVAGDSTSDPTATAAVQTIYIP